MDYNPFAPPRTTDLESREAPADVVLDPEAVAALKSGGRWAQGVAVLSALWAAISLVELAVGRVPGFSGVRLALLALCYPVSLYAAWLTWRFASAARAASADNESLERLARRQHQLYAAYALQAFVLIGSTIATTVLKDGGPPP